jgi:lipopolysaccharide export system protein LptA
LGGVADEKMVAGQMLSSVERLRMGLLVGAGLLVAVIGGFLWYAHYRTHRILRDLPGRLGATITKQFGAYTYSQSLQGKTVFTIHAAQAVQHTDGNYTLHDVNMVMYGRKGDRADHISGSEFEYDQKAGLVHAVGIVHLDLEAPPADGAPGKPVAGQGDSQNAAAKPKPARDGAANDRVIHITTSGLVYSQKQNLATTDQEIEFSFAGLTGRALGAQYNSATGYVVLQAAVEVSGLERGQPVLLRATHGEYDRQAEQVTLKDARYSSAGETAAADEGTVYLRQDGSAQRIVGDRDVRLGDAGQGVVTSDHADVTLTPQSKPEIGILTGAVHYADDEPLRQARGDAQQATLHFDGQGKLEHALLVGGKNGGRVRSSERVRAGDTASPNAWSTRDLIADTVELALGTDAAGKTELRDATAVGAARLTTVAAVTAAKTGNGAAGETTNKLSGDRLQAHFIPVRGQSQVSTVHGMGHTVLEQIAATGVDQVSAGDSLDVYFRAAPATAGGKKADGQVGAVEVANAVQLGNVAITRTVPAALVPKGTKSSGPDVQHAVAQRADYDGDTNLLTLTGGAEITDAQSVLWANRVSMQQQTGDATADGAVKVTYLQAGDSGQAGASSQPGDAGEQPVHVLAARAELKHDAGRATFYGAGACGGVGPQLARMWQSGAPGEGGSQVEAPVLIFEQAQKRLTARGADGGAPMAVHTVLVSAPRKDGASPAGVPKKRAGASSGVDAGEPQVVRVTSRQMVYSDATRQAEFTGGVRVLDADGDMRAQQATAFLRASGSASGSGSGQPAKSSGAAGAGVLGGEVERIVATGQVDITQPGRHATGERLVYTASDQMFVLTGTKATPPKVVDAQQGTATGASLRFHSGDDSVVISGDGAGASGERPRTETKVKK